MKQYAAQFGKAVYAGLIAAGGALTTVMVGTDMSFGDITDAQWLSTVLAGLLAGGGVYHLPYAPAGGSNTSTTSTDL